MNVEQFKHNIICQFKQTDSPAQWLMRRDSRLTRAQNQYFMESGVLYHQDFNLQIKVRTVLDSDRSIHFEVVFSEDKDQQSRKIVNSYADLSSVQFGGRQSIVETVNIQGDTLEFTLKYISFKIEDGHLTMSEAMAPLGSRAYFSLRTLMMSDNTSLKRLINQTREVALLSGYHQTNYVEYLSSESDMILLKQALDDIPLSKDTKEDIYDVFAKTKHGGGYKITTLENLMVELMCLAMY